MVSSLKWATILEPCPGEIRTAEVEPRKIDVTKHRAREVDVIQGGVKPARKAPILFPTMVSSFVTASISSGESGWYIWLFWSGGESAGIAPRAGISRTESEATAPGP